MEWLCCGCGCGCAVTDCACLWRGGGVAGALFVVLVFRIIVLVFSCWRVVGGEEKGMEANGRCHDGHS